MKFILIILLIFSVSLAYAQVGEIYKSTADDLAVRSGPGETFEILTKLKADEAIEIEAIHNKDWYIIELGTQEGYVRSDKMIPDDTWSEVDMKTGDQPKCLEITSQNPYIVENALVIRLDESSDAVVKLMRVDQDREDFCVRTGFINAGDSLKFTKIPEGEYYLLMALGRGWKKKNAEGECIEKFIKWAIYKKGSVIFDFNLVKSEEGIGVPFYNVLIGVTHPDDTELPYLEASRISEEEFGE